MTGFVDLQRRFHELTDSELEDIDVLVSWSGSEFGPDIGWSKLLEYTRVILLAEAGAGKTAEMQEQANRLAGEGRFAFFVPLESLDREPIAEILSVAEEERLGQWKADGKEPAWFFLDAVDELKLTEGKLDRALNRLSREIDGHLERARIIISCRPSDWRSSADLNTVQYRHRCLKSVASLPSGHARRCSLTRSGMSMVDRRVPSAKKRKFRVGERCERSPCFR